MIDNSNIDEVTLDLAQKLSDDDYQLNMLTEECAEAIIAVNHFRRNRVEAIKLAEEIADVYIMCQKVAKIIGLHLVDQQVIFKMQRLRGILAERLKEEANALKK